MARLLTSNGGTDRPWDDKAEEGQKTKPLTKEEFLSLHVRIWGSLEFCRSCYGIVYNGECSGCKEQDKGGSRYKVSRLAGNNTGVSLIEKHLQHIRAQAKGGTLTGTSTTSVMDFRGPVVDFGGPVVGRLRDRLAYEIIGNAPGVAGAQPQPVVNFVEGADIAPAQHFIYFDANGNVIPPDQGDGEINLEGIEVDPPVDDYNEPPEYGEDPPDEEGEDDPRY